LPGFPEIIDVTLLLLIAAGFLAGFIDSIAGGGGLIVIPSLLLTGMAPVEALGTNKLQGLFGSGSASLAYARKGHVDLKKQLPSSLLAFLGSALGAITATFVSPKWFAMVLPFVLVAIALYFALKPDLGDVDRKQRLAPLAFALTAIPLIGYYDGIFGPGTGSFFMLAFVSLAGFGVLKATAHTKLLNFSSNFGAFAIFTAIGVINWKIGLLMGFAQMAGAMTGSSLAMKNGAKLIRPLLVVTCVLLAAKLFWQG
jgi:uncharacterized membrane protein YfcA